MNNRDAYLLGKNLKFFFGTLSDDEKIEFGKIVLPKDVLNAYASLNVLASDILNSKELKEFNSLIEQPYDTTPAQSSSMVIVLKCAHLCSLCCIYCNAWREGLGNVMPFRVVAKVIGDALNAPGIKRVEFVWHGEKSTLLSVNFYKKVLWLQEYFCPNGVNYENGMQTNAFDISEEMLVFLKTYNFSLGISFDGPPLLNDARRFDKQGKPTSSKIIATIKRLQEHGIPIGALIVVDHLISKYPPNELLDYFCSLHISSLDVLNALPENHDDESCVAIGTYLPYPDFVRYLCRLYLVWVKSYSTKIEIRTFSSLLNALKRSIKGICIFNGNCQGSYITIESNGEITVCDKYVNDENDKYGSIFNGGLYSSLARSDNLIRSKIELQMAFALMIVNYLGNIYVATFKMMPVAIRPIFRAYVSSGV